MGSHILTGKKGEEIAQNYLLKNNYIINASNWRYKKVEVDIIAYDEQILVFIEVKTRTVNTHGFPEEAVTEKKQQNILNAAAYYLEAYNLDVEIRFDVIAITLKPKLDILHITDAFFPGWDIL